MDKSDRRLLQAKGRASHRSETRAVPPNPQVMICSSEAADRKSPSTRCAAGEARTRNARPMSRESSATGRKAAGRGERGDEQGERPPELVVVSGAADENQHAEAAPQQQH